MAIYQENGFYLEYPDHWEPIFESEVGSDVLSFTSESGSFWSLSRLFTWVDQEELLVSLVEDLCSQYKDCEVKPVVETIGEVVLTGMDIDFFYLDFPCTIQVRAYTTGMSSYILYIQTAETGDVSEGENFRSLTESWLKNIEKEVKNF
ncbi:MAG: hypothetical protein Q4E67_02780 [Planctomycetia bacterium]|nr:hypothetical protein [Planctomycetia bacterium]